MGLSRWVLGGVAVVLFGVLVSISMPRLKLMVNMSPIDYSKDLGKLPPCERCCDGKEEDGGLMEERGLKVLPGLIKGGEALTYVEPYIYTGLTDGWIVRFDPRKNSSESFERIAHTGKIIPECGTMAAESICGRPLGVVPLDDGNLIVADSYLGLLQVNTVNKKISLLVDSIAGQKVMILNSIIVVEGIVYFTVSSKKYQRKQFLFESIEGRPSGYLASYNIATGEAKVEVGGIAFANGLCLTHSNDALLIASTTRHRIYKYGIHGPTKGLLTVFADSLPTAPDNLQRGTEPGTYLLAGATKRSEPFCVTDWLAGHPLLRRIVTLFIKPDHMHWHGVVMKLNERGECIGMLEDCAPFLHIVCDSLEVDDTLYVATLYTDLWAFNTKQLPSTSTWAHNRTMK